MTRTMARQAATRAASKTRSSAPYPACPARVLSVSVGPTDSDQLGPQRRWPGWTDLTRALPQTAAPRPVRRAHFPEGPPTLPQRDSHAPPGRLPPTGTASVSSAQPGHGLSGTDPSGWPPGRGLGTAPPPGRTCRGGVRRTVRRGATLPTSPVRCLGELALSRATPITYRPAGPPQCPGPRGLVCLGELRSAG
jgi:hypothetical protein